MISVDDIIDTQASNVITIGDYLDNLDGILQLFCNMKADAIAFEGSIFILSEQIDTEGVVTEQNLASYNATLQSLLNGYLIYLSIKRPSANGIAKNLISTWTSTNKHSTHQLSFMDTQYRWYRCKDMCSVDNIQICDDFGGCGLAARLPIKVGCGNACFDSISEKIVEYDANALYKLDVNCKEIYTNIGATYSGTDPQDKAANAIAADFTFTAVDSDGDTTAIVFADPTTTVTYDDVFGIPGSDGAQTGSITIEVSVTNGSLCNVSANVITTIELVMSANYTAANVGTEFDTIMVDSVTLTKKRMGFSNVVDYKYFLCNLVPDKIHLLLSLLDKNCYIIAKCLNHVNLLIGEYNLLQV
jgi:hypothetical protein